MIEKDAVLAKIVNERSGNIARFASFAPTGKLRYSLISANNGLLAPKNELEAAIILMQVGAPSVNIRTFLKDKPDGNPFEIGLTDTDEIFYKCRQYRERDYYIIVNENLSLGEGSISGVLSPGELAEFAPDDSPRCVEKEGCCSMSREMLRRFVDTVYQRPLNIPFERLYRVEFSQYPSPVGYFRNDNNYTIIWQAEKFANAKFRPAVLPQWPNKLSQYMGDKAFGLVMAYVAGERVPAVHIQSRYFPLIHFGIRTESPHPKIIRTAPRVPLPGKWVTTPEPFDIFKYIPDIDPKHKNLKSIIIQDHIPSEWSGTATLDTNGSVIIEGVKGTGEDYMIGAALPAKIPGYVVDEILYMHERLSGQFGLVRKIEWAYYRGTPWVFQLHVGKSTIKGNIIVEGRPKKWLEWRRNIRDIDDIQKFRTFVENIKEDCGIKLIANVGIGSHYCDILIRHQIPSKLIKK